MNIQPINYADISLVEIKMNRDIPNRTPHCKLHGAMNKMNTLEDGGGYWRCVTYVTKNNDNACRAGCIEIRNK